MKLQFIGATGTVTGSKYLLTHGDRNILIDCGLFQGLKVLRQRNWSKLPLCASDIDAVILTHAHIDHSGYLPLLVKQGFKGPVYATEATKDLCAILLPDAGHLQEEDAAYANRKGFSRHHPALPLYTEEDGRNALASFNPLPWREPKTLGDGLSFKFFHAGHILGASVVQLQTEGVTVTFSGDLGRPRNIVMKAPAPLTHTDYLIVESTYGSRLHPKDDTKAILGDLVRKTVKRGGTVLIPAFAVGRAQEVLHLLADLKADGAIPDIPVYLNSPMATQATRIFCRYLGEHLLTEEQCDAMCEKTTFVATVEDSIRLNERNDPCVIVSASGMATGGRVLHHLKKLLPDPKNLVLLAGFQAAGTRGEILKRGNGTVKIHGLQIPIKAEVASMDNLSAHADSDEILGWLKHLKIPPKMTFITHGEPLESEALRIRIQDELGWPCKVPDYLETVGL